MESGALLLDHNQGLCGNAGLVFCLGRGGNESGHLCFGRLECCAPPGELLTKLSAVGVSLAHIGKSGLNLLSAQHLGLAGLLCVKAGALEGGGESCQSTLGSIALRG